MMLPQCQFQQIVHHFFRDHSRVVAKWPLPFLLVPLLVTGALGAALVVFRDRLEEKFEEDRLSLFLPEEVPAMGHMDTLKKVFPSQDILRDSYDVFKTAFTYVIIEDTSPQKNVLRNSILRIAGEIHHRVREMEVSLGWLAAKWSDLCYRREGVCLEHPVIVLLNGSDPLSTIRFFLKYPTFKIGNESINNAPIFGSVSLNEDNMIISAQALRIPYILQDYSHLSQDLRILNYLWQNSFVHLLSTIQYEGVRIYYTSSISWAEEIDRNGKMILPFLPLLFLVLLLFSVGSCFTGDWVVSKPWLGLCGILNAIFAVIAAIAVLVLLGYPFLQMIFIMPFLILSISVDNMFLMLSSFRNTHPLQSVEERMGAAVGETAVSVMITALTDGLSFSVGSISQFPAVRIFCTYCALAILFVFIYQMTFFVACMALTGRREAANRHCITCSVALPKSQARGKAMWYRLFCTGGFYDSSGGRRLPSKLSAHFLTEFLSSIYADILNALPSKVFVIIVYLGYLGISVYSLIGLPLGLDLKLLVPQDSYTAMELEASERHFSSYGGNAYVYLGGGTKPIPYHRREVTRDLVRLYRTLSRTEFTEGGEFWLLDFHRFSNQTSFENKEQFMRALLRFLAEPANKRFRNDVSIEGERGKEKRIEASKMLLRMRYVTFSNHTKIAGRLRRIFKDSKFGSEGFIYEPSFLLVDQEESILQNLLQNVGIAVGVMLLIAFLFIPKLLSAIWIGISILSINVGVVGGLAAWGVRLDIVSMITICMSIGFSVDFIAHITYHFLISRGKDRLHKALRYVGTPILQSAASTVLGVCSLIPADSYMVRTFVKTVVLVVGLGVIHGLVFLPVILSLFIPADHYLEALGTYKSRMGHYLSNNIPKLTNRIANKRMQPYLESTTSDEIMTSDESVSEVIPDLPPPPPPPRGGPTRHRSPTVHRPPPATSSSTTSHSRHDPPLPPRRKEPHRRSTPHRRAAPPVPINPGPQTLDLYQFLKFKAGRLDLAQSSSEQDIYSEVCQDTCKSCGPHGCQMHSSVSAAVNCRNRSDEVSARNQHRRSFNEFNHHHPPQSTHSRGGSRPMEDEYCDTFQNSSIHNFRKHSQPVAAPNWSSRNQSGHGPSSGLQFAPRSRNSLTGRGDAPRLPSNLSSRLSSFPAFPPSRLDSTRLSSRMYLKRNETPRLSRTSNNSRPFNAELPPPPRQTLQNFSRAAKSRHSTGNLEQIVPDGGETVEIVLRGNLGSRSMLRKSVSAEHLHKSLESVDSDAFGAFQGGVELSGGREMSGPQVPSLATFKGATTMSTQILQASPPPTYSSGSGYEVEEIYAEGDDQMLY